MYSSTPAERGWGLWISASKASIAIGHTNGSDVEFVGGTSDMPDRRWQHILVSYQHSSKDYAIYRYNPNTDTEEIDTGTFSNSMDPTTGGDFSLGRYYPQNFGATNADIDEVYVFNDVVSVTEWRQIYAGTYHDTLTPQGNDFSGDPNWINQWLVFDSGGEWYNDDGIGNDPWTGPVNVTDWALSRESITAKVGDYAIAAWLFQASDPHAHITNASLPASYPGEAQVDFSICSWVYFTGVMPSTNAEDSAILSHNNAWRFGVEAGADEPYFSVYGGAAWQEIDLGTSVIAGRWYHITGTYEHSSKNYRLSVWDDTAGALAAADVTGTFGSAMDGGASGDLFLAVTSVSTGSCGQYINETLVFDRVLSVADIATIVAGGFSMASGTDVIHGMMF